MKIEAGMLEGNVIAKGGTSLFLSFLRLFLSCCQFSKQISYQISVEPAGRK